MKVLHIMASGNSGGIEVLMKNYEKFSKNNNIFLFVWDGGAIFEEMKNNGATCILLGEPTGHFIHNVAAIISVCKRIKPDAVVTHHGVPQFKAVLAYLKLRYPQIKRIAYAHANANDIAQNGNKVKSFLNKSISRIGFDSAETVIAISQSVADSLVNVFSISKSKIVMIYNGVSIDEFKPEEKKRDGWINIVYVGRLIPEKGVQTTIQAMHLLPKNYRFLVAGDGSYRKALESLCLHIEDRVVFLGNRMDVPQILAQSDIFVHMPEWEEGFGITVIEAMAAGKICFVANSGSMPEIITDGVNGFLIEKGNAVALADKIQEVVNHIDSMEIMKIKENAVTRANDFSIERFAKNLDCAILGESTPVTVI